MRGRLYQGGYFLKLKPLRLLSPRSAEIIKERCDSENRLLHELGHVIDAARSDISLLKVDQSLNDSQKRLVMDLHSTIEWGNSVLRIAQFDLTNIDVELIHGSRIDAATLIRYIISEIEVVKQWYQHRRLEVIVDCPYLFESDSLFVDHLSIGLAIKEVIKNGCQYCFDDTRIEVTIIPKKKGLQVLCSSTGLALSPEGSEQCTQKFWISDRAKAVNPLGRGLGLWRAERVANLHNGSLKVECCDDLTTVTINFQSIGQSQ